MKRKGDIGNTGGSCTDLFAVPPDSRAFYESDTRRQPSASFDAKRLAIPDRLPNFAQEKPEPCEQVKAAPVEVFTPKASPP